MCHDAPSLVNLVLSLTAPPVLPSPPLTAPLPLPLPSQTDAGAKSSEFILWALDVKKVDIETMPKNEERELFRDFIEDYNTGGCMCVPE